VFLTSRNFLVVLNEIYYDIWRVLKGLNKRCLSMCVSVCVGINAIRVGAFGCTTCGKW